MKPGEVTRASVPDAELLIKVKEILPPDPAESEKEIASLAQRLRGAVAEDLSMSFGQGLKQRFPVRIDRSQIEKLY